MENTNLHDNKPILGFDGPYRFLSNFWYAEVEFEGKVYPGTEWAYQAAKTLDENEREQIRLAEKPGLAKKLGKKVTLRPDFSDIKLEIMYQLVKQKFEKHPKLKEKLLATGNSHLEECNTWSDTVWGTCNGIGDNHLGKILMRVREELRNE